MNYIVLLSDEELTEVCRLISGNILRDLYKSNSKEFTKIKRGFRPNKISNEVAINIAVQSRNVPFISVEINKHIEKWIKQIDELLSERPVDKDQDIYLTEALSKTVFANNVSLYFKLKGSDVTVEYAKSIQDAVDALLYIDGTSVKPNDSSKSSIGGDADEIEDLTSKIGELTENHKKEMTELQSRYDEVSKTNAELSIKISRLELEKSSIEEELKVLKARLEYDDYEAVEEILERSENHISFCMVSERDYNGENWLIRLADVNKNGRLETFYFNGDLPWYYENRPRLFFKDGPAEEGRVGVWDWVSIPNKNDPTKDYVNSSYNPELCPAEVITIDSCGSAEDILQALKTGISMEISTPKVIIAAYLHKGKFTGFLCGKKDFVDLNGVWKLSEQTITIPQYDFSGKDTIRLENGKSYFRKISIGVPTALVQVKDPLEYVKEIVMGRYSWQYFKQFGKTRNDWKKFKDIISLSELEPIVETISKDLNYSEAKANSLLEDFIQNAAAYIDGTTVEDQVLLGLLAVNEVLQERCKDLLTEEWKVEHVAELEQARGELDKVVSERLQIESEIQKKISDGEARVKARLDAGNASIAELQKKENELQRQLDEIEGFIAEKTGFAERVETIVADRIKKAQKNAAEFIAGMAFINPPQTHTTVESQALKPVTSGINTVIQTVTGGKCFVSGKKLDEEQLDEAADWNITLDILADALNDSGVIASYSRPLAAYLLSAYFNNCPVLLAGPNSNEIADAVAASVSGKTAGVLDFNEPYSSDSIRECWDGEDEVVKICNPFSAAWVAQLPEIISKKGKYCIAVYPYVEDIQIEPKSMFNYVLPIFTDLVIERNASSSILGSIPSARYKSFSIVRPEKLHDKLMNSLHMTALIKMRYQVVLSNMHKMLGNKNMDFDIVFSLMPYAFSTMQMEKMIEVIRNPEQSKIRISAEAMRIIESYLGGEE